MSISSPSWYVPSTPRSYWRITPTGLNPTFSYVRIARALSRRRVDRQPVVAADLDEVARERPHGVRAQAAALEPRRHEDVDAGAGL